MGSPDERQDQRPAAWRPIETVWRAGPRYLDLIRHDKISLWVLPVMPIISFFADHQ
jgi:hypothetical protein